MASKRLQRKKISFKELPFGNTSCPCQNAFEKCTTKTELCNGKSYIKKAYTRVQLKMPSNVPA